jgi:FAD dependent oxidoreductase TIGR03364
VDTALNRGALNRGATNKESAIVIGAGIVGLAVARSLAVRGHAVTVLERSERAVGASVRNFGSLWPIGVPNGALYERALQSRSIWLSLLRGMQVWHTECGSLHAARERDEMLVLERYTELNRGIRPVRCLSAAEARKLSPALVEQGLHGGLFCGDELLLDPREAIRAIPGYLEETYGVRFRWGVAANLVESGVVHAGRERFQADRVYICSGPEFEWLFPQVFAAAGLTRCKLQMMRLAPPAPRFQLGPALASGLSLVHYTGFGMVPEVAQVRERLQRERPDLLDLGIHMLVMQNGRGEITVGDSHAYAHTHDPFDEQAINSKILDYVQQVVRLPELRVVQTWHGIYPKLTDGSTDLIHSPLPGVTIVNGLGGLGMTLSFGLAEELVEGRLQVPA